jgi:hypothetical protein
MSRFITFFILMINLYSLPMKAVDFASLLPSQANGWSTADSDHYYNNETLYDYIDGGAELYISYGFDKVISRRYTCSNEPDIVVEIFDMIEPRNAFGAFTNMREKNQHQFGQGSQQIEGSLIFWKDHYFISLVVEKYTDKSLQAIQEIAHFIDNAIPKQGNLPSVLQYLPSQDSVPEGYCYFHHYIWLNSFYYISNNNILNIDASTNAVIAKYGPPDKRVYFLVVQYPNTETALAAYDKFINQFSPELKKKDAIELEDKTWHTASLQGTMVAAVFNAPGKNKAIELIEQWKTKVSGKKIH